MKTDYSSRENIILHQPSLVGPERPTKQDTLHWAGCLVLHWSDLAGADTQIYENNHAYTSSWGRCRTLQVTPKSHVTQSYSSSHS